jgi:Ca2+-binding RTX toxin-like protein
MKVKDDDTGETIVTRSQTIVVAQLESAPCGCGTALVIGGTLSAETIQVSAVTGGLQVFINGISLGVFNPSHAIVVHAYAGNDDVQIAGSIALTAWIYGGDGDDRLKGGAGADIIQGQVGHDLLVGGAGRDLLIGGIGQDRIVGNSDDDILVSGTTNHDNTPAALCAILAEWNSSRWGYERVANIYGVGCGTRLNGNYFLNDNTVHDDGERDVLTGSSGFDWFFANLSLYNDDSPTKDKITDQNWWEFAKDIDFIES